MKAVDIKYEGCYLQQVSKVNSLWPIEQCR